MNGCHNCTHYHPVYQFRETLSEKYYCDFDGIEYSEDYICENHNRREE